MVTAILLMGASAVAAQAAPTTPSSEPAALARTLQSKNAGEAAASAYWLGLKGAAAVPEIPLLIAALGDERPVNPATYRAAPRNGPRSTPGEEAAQALARIGAPAVDPLILALRASNSAAARKNAAWALGQIDMEAHAPNSAATPRRGESRQN